MDLSNLSNVRSGTADFLSGSDKLNVLISNAGVSLTAETMTVDGFELAMGTNHFAHFLFFQLLKLSLLKSSTSEFHSRVVNVAASGHRISPTQFHDMNFSKEGYSKWRAVSWISRDLLQLSRVLDFSAPTTVKEATIQWPTQQYNIRGNQCILIAIKE